MKVCKTCSRRYPDNALRCPEDQSVLVELTQDTRPAGTDNLIGQRMFGDYVIERKLGEGGMGTVYLAKHVSIDQSVAVKVLHGHAAESSELVQRFNREAKAIARLTHPNIIRVFVFGRTPDGLIYLAMEYVQGKSLRELLERDGVFSELHAIYVLKQVLGALAEAHDLGIIHRDLKPDNILLTEYRGNPEFVKVLDFGIAKVKEPDGEPEVQLTKAGVVYGTPEYLSPEQAQAKPLDGRSDLYSVGIILWELLTGDVPFTGKSAMSVLVRHVYDPPGDPLERNPTLSPTMVEILSKAIEKDADDRFQTAAEFQRALEACEAQLKASGRATHERKEVQSVNTRLWSPPSGFFERAQNAPHDADDRGTAVEVSVSGSPQVSPDSAGASSDLDTLTYPHAPPPNRARSIALGALFGGLLLLLAMAIVFIVILLNERP